MFSKKASVSASVDTFIGINSTFEGNINLKDTIRVDGKVIGNINTEQDVIIGEKATITGNIYASNIIISGTVKGNITAKDQLRLTTSSNLIGDIQTKSLITDEGAIFKGNCEMTEPSQSKNTSPKPKEKDNQPNK